MKQLNPEREARLARDRLLGWSLSCPLIEPGARLGRDLELTNGEHGLDLERVRGMDALTLALSIALTTLRGNDVFNVDFGFDGLNALVEETDPLLARERIRVAVAQLLGREPRVKNILDIKLVDGRLQLTDEATLLDTSTEEDRLAALRAREVSIGMSFQTISGEQTRLDLKTVGING